MPMIDLAKSLDLEPVPPENYSNSLTIVTEFNSSIQGFLVEDVDRIVHLKWEDILAPPDSLQNVNYLTGITRAQDQVVQIVDVEKVLAEVSGSTHDLSDEFLVSHATKVKNEKFFVLGADDSSVARSQLKGILDEMGIANKIVNNGKLALEFLQKWADDAEKGISERVSSRILMVISDIEMPEMDGYTLTTSIRKDERLKDLFVVLNSSLSGGFNESLTEKVGANVFLSKWHSDKLASVIVQRINQVEKASQRQA
jgi:two-component system chemotaxis response regulator CheV